MGFILNVAKGCAAAAIPRRHRGDSRHVPIEAPSGGQQGQLASSTQASADLAKQQGQVNLIAATLDFLIRPAGNFLATLTALV